MSPFRDEYKDMDDSGSEGSAGNHYDARERQRASQYERNRTNNGRISSNSNGNSTRPNSNSLNNGRVPRRWIYDRVNGTSRIEGVPLRRHQPPCFLCFPPPMLKVCPWLLEENCLCRLLGQCGCCVESGGLRSNALKFALWLNICGFLVTIFAALALTDDEYDLLSISSFGKADLEPTRDDGVQSTIDYPTINLHLGLRALAVKNPNSAGVASMTTTTVIPFDEFCTAQGMEQLMPLQDCDACSDTYLYLLIGILVALTAQVPTFATDYLRLYTNYDVNCQKVSASLWGMVCLAGYGLVYYYFNEVCAASFYKGQIQYSADGTLVEKLEDPPDDGSIAIDFDWKVGTGQICLLVAFGLKILQMVCNCCVSTPTITRNRKEQWDYENKFAKKAVDDENDGRNAGDDDKGDGDDDNSDEDDSASESSH